MGISVRIETNLQVAGWKAHLVGQEVREIASAMEEASVWSYCTEMYYGLHKSEHTKIIAVIGIFYKSRM